MDDLEVRNTKEMSARGDKDQITAERSDIDDRFKKGGT
jgi:hypothetical protein